MNGWFSNSSNEVQEVTVRGLKIDSHQPTHRALLHSVEIAGRWLARSCRRPCAGAIRRNGAIRDSGRDSFLSIVAGAG
jgi:hypothetical protein